MLNNKTGVQFVKEDLRNVSEKYILIKHCIQGENAIKEYENGLKYLPNPSELDEDDKSKAIARYEIYKYRAFFFNSIKNTLNGLTGQLFSKPPSDVHPDKLEPVFLSPAGDNVHIIQQCKNVAEDVLSLSRAGLLVDFPRTGGNITKAEFDTGKIRATITHYHPEDIINWKVIDDGADQILSMIVLSEEREVTSSQDKFVTGYVTTYRVLELTDTGVIQSIWEPENIDSLIEKNVNNALRNYSVIKYIQKESFEMLDSKGKPLKRIPFKLIGLISNSHKVEEPAMYDMAVINIHHYHNSADYEENCYICGQATPVVSGLTEHWYTTVMNKKIPLGSRGGLALNEGADAKFIQAQPNAILIEAMKHKENLMKALGVKFIEPNLSVEKTATQSKIESAGEKSLLESASKNISEAYLWALRLACDLMNIPYTDETLKFQLNSDFEISRLDSSEMALVVQCWQEGLLGFGESRLILRSKGWASSPDKDIEQELKKKQEEKFNQEKALKEAGKSQITPQKGN